MTKSVMENLRQPEAIAYGDETLTNTAHDLCTGDKSLKYRVADAYIDHLVHLKQENIPDSDSWYQISEISSRLAKNEDTVIGSVQALAEDLNYVDAKYIALKILEIHRSVCAHVNDVR